MSACECANVCVGGGGSFRQILIICSYAGLGRAGFQMLVSYVCVCDCVSCFNKQAVTGQLLTRDMQGGRAL